MRIDLFFPCQSARSIRGVFENIRIVGFRQEVSIHNTTKRRLNDLMIGANVFKHAMPVKNKYSAHHDDEMC